jgi:hypothetical protein
MGVMFCVKGVQAVLKLARGTLVMFAIVSMKAFNSSVMLPT